MSANDANMLMCARANAESRARVYVYARFIGLAAYQFDSNLRNSTMVGIVGGGGIGAALFTAYQRFDYDVVLTILLLTIALIMLAEVLSLGLKRVFR